MTGRHQRGRSRGTRPRPARPPRGRGRSCGRQFERPRRPGPRPQAARRTLGRSGQRVSALSRGPAPIDPGNDRRGRSGRRGVAVQPLLVRERNSGRCSDLYFSRMIYCLPSKRLLWPGDDRAFISAETIAPFSTRAKLQLGRAARVYAAAGSVSPPLPAASALAEIARIDARFYQRQPETAHPHLTPLGEAMASAVLGGRPVGKDAFRCSPRCQPLAAPTVR